MSFFTGHNTPGYLPDTDQPAHEFRTFEDAKLALLSDLEFATDYAADEDEAEEFSSAAEDVNLWSGPDSVHIDSVNTVYWIVEDMTDEERDIRRYVGIDAADPFPSFAFPGGYPILYVTDDAETLCARCVNDLSNPIHFTGDKDGWRVDGATIHYEGADEHCAHCNAVIESAYGDPYADEDSAQETQTQDSTDYAAIEVCEDCYFAHHYGAHQHEGQWYAGESDTPADRKPLGLIADTAQVTDHTDCNADEDTGITEFSWSRCDGCGSTLGGSRYRLAVWF